MFDGKYDSMTKKEALAVELAERIAMDPHSVTDEFWQKLKTEFSDKEIVELVYACGIFNWGNKFNITMRLDTDDKSEYPVGMDYKESDAFWRKKPT